MPESQPAMNPTPDGAATNTAATVDSGGATRPAAETEAGASQEQAKTFTQAELDSIVKARLKEDRTAREKQAKRAEMDEIDRTKAELAESKTELYRYRARDQFLVAARDAKLPDPETLYELFGSKLQFDDKGELDNLKAVIEEAKSKTSKLMRGAGGNNSIDASARGSGVTVGDQMNMLIRHKAGRV